MPRAILAGKRSGLIKMGKVMDSHLIGHEFRFFGHRFRVLRSSRDTFDTALRIEYMASPRASIREHVHHFQEERFEIVSGTLGVRVGERTLILSPGQKAHGPPGVPHAWWNPSDGEEVCFVAEIRPGVDVEILFETVLGLARDGKAIGYVPRNPLQLAVMARQIGGGMAYPTGIPMPVRKALFAPVALLAFVGRLLGYMVRYPEYSGPEAARD